MEADIRRATPADVEVLMPLIVDHATYERAVASCLPERLRSALSSGEPRLIGWVAFFGGDAVGYATATIDFSTWKGRDYLHLDCLFVYAAHRGNGIGAALLSAARAFATSNHLSELQWQTPIWNEDATRFYRRIGASDSVKRRFSWSQPGSGKRRSCAEQRFE